MKKEFLVERQGKSLVLYAGLLDEAHQHGLKAIRTKLLQIPNQENGNVAICLAEVETEQGCFTGIGDAAPESVSRLMMPHLIRMAETRAKARALRDSINVGVVAIEELGELEEIEHAVTEEQREGKRTELPAARRSDNGSTQPAAGKQVTGTGTSLSQQPSKEEADSKTANPVMATPAQVRAIYLIARDQRGLSETQIEERSREEYRCLPAELTKRQASALITALKR